MNNWEMSIIKIKKFFSWVLLFYMAVPFIECIILTAAAYAGWAGFGGVTMEYTKKGEQCVGVLIFFPPLLFLGVLVCRLLRFHCEKKAAGFYIMELLRCIMGGSYRDCGILFPDVVRCSRACGGENSAVQNRKFGLDALPDTLVYLI